jgi:Domain of unknown function (DUF5671)
MSQASRLSTVIDSALAAGIPHDTLVGLLRTRGWSENDIYDALAAHYQQQTGVDIPYRSGAAASARDAFLYLVLFCTLATWATGIGCLAFALIDRWLTDSLFAGYGGFDAYTIPSSLAAILVAYPLFLLVSRALAKEAAADPDRLESGVRKWLTYMALVIAAGVFMGDLINALAYLLRGELTSRFVAKTFVVLALSGGIFFHYFGGLRRTDDPARIRRRNRLMALVASSAVLLMVILGFVELGAPMRQRKLRADNDRVNSLYRASSSISFYWKAHNDQLPARLSQIPGNWVDPVTHTPYSYLPGQGSQYQLCARFDLSSDGRQAPQAAGDDLWVHPSGQHCFQFDASVPVPYPHSPGYPNYY